MLQFRSLFSWTLALFLAALSLMGPAQALEPVSVNNATDAIDLLPAAQFFSSQGDRLSVQTAPGADGVVKRMEVRARQPGSNPSWVVFALANTTEDQIDRVLVAPHYRLVGSGLVWPDLGGRRLIKISSSEDVRLVQQDSVEADIFQVTLNPRSRITFVVELGTSKLPQLYLWKPEAYKDKVNSLTLYKGIVMGVAGLLALFLTIAFVVKGTTMFPAAAALAWAVVAYLAVDFGFLHKFFAFAAGGDRTWRAGAEAVFSATLLVFLFAYLNLNRWHVRYSYVSALWFVALAALVVLAVVDAPVAAGVARISIATLAAVGFLVIVFLALYHYDRAVMLIPTWTLLLAWVVAAGMTMTGRLTNDLVQPALVGGLVLIIMLIGFTVMQHAFAGGGLSPGLISDAERKALALTGSGDIVWDWDVAADHIYVSPEAESALGLARSVLEGPASRWLELIHVLDRDRFRTALDSIIDQRRGRVNQEFRVRAGDNHYMWLTLKARPIVGSDGEVSRCVGTLVDTTEQRTAQERMLHDAIYDNLTGLANRELFMDRLESALVIARQDPKSRPTVLMLDLDNYKQVNEAVGRAVGNSVLLTVARRLGRLMKPRDSLARVAGDQFAMMIVSERETDKLSALAEAVRKTLRTPVTVRDHEILLTASIGLVAPDDEGSLKAEDLVKDAEMAMYNAKRNGGDRIEVFRPIMRDERSSKSLLEKDLRRALERDEMKLLFRPIVRLDDSTLAGFEAVMYWDHVILGRLPPLDYAAAAEETGTVVDIILLTLERTARQLATWQGMSDSDPPIFATVSLESRQLLRHELIQDIKTIMTRTDLAVGSLRLEVPESLVLENPEYTAQILTEVRDLGTSVRLTGFGIGYSSFEYLQRVPFDTIKIDQRFLKKSQKSNLSALFRSVVAIAHDLDADVIAEGADSDADAAALFDLGCDYAQGHAFGDPMTAEEARRLMSAPAKLRA